MTKLLNVILNFITKNFPTIILVIILLILIDVINNAWKKHKIKKAQKKQDKYFLKYEKGNYNKIEIDKNDIYYNNNYNNKKYY